MEVSLFFSPLEDHLFSKNENTLGKQVDAYIEDTPSWKEADIVILGVPDYRGGDSLPEEKAGLLQIREAFYHLKNNFSQLKIADLGNLNLGMSLEDTYLRLEEVIANLLQENCLPIILGGGHGLTYAQYRAYASLEQYVHLINVDSRIDLGEGDSCLQDNSFLEKLFVEKPNFLFDYSHLGYHSFLTSKEDLRLLEEVGFTCFRIGELKNDIQETEPIIRNGNFMSVDINSLRASDSPCSSTPFGFSAEEACQMMWYAGQHEQMSSLGLYGYSSVTDVQNRSAKVYATMLWYFIDGYYARKGTQTVFDANYTKYIVPFESYMLTFYKDNLTDKWWLEIIHQENTNKLERNTLIPCSHADYQEAINGKLPDRWIQALGKLHL